MSNQRSAPDGKTTNRPGLRSRRAPQPVAAPDQLELEFVRFGPREKALNLRVDLGADTIWATQAQMAEMFGVGAAAVSKELSTLKAEGGLGAVRPGSAGSGDLYDLDAILGGGYRVSSGKAAAFRRWAGQTLRASAVDGFALNEARLRDDPSASDRLAARLIREAGLLMLPASLWHSPLATLPVDRIRISLGHARVWSALDVLYECLHACRDGIRAA